LPVRTTPDKAGRSPPRRGTDVRRTRRGPCLPRRHISRGTGLASAALTSPAPKGRSAGIPAVHVGDTHRKSKIGQAVGSFGIGESGAYELTRSGALREDAR